MFVKRSDDFDTLRAVVYLVKMCPQEINAVPPAMPPIKDECCNKVGYNHTKDGRNIIGKVEQRKRWEPLFLAYACKQHYAQLYKIYAQYPYGPGGYFGEFPSNVKPFNKETYCKRDEYDGKHDSMDF